MTVITTTITPHQALLQVLENTRPLPAVSVPLAEALGCVLAEPVLADRDYPPFDRATMDGYACTTADAGRTASIQEEIPAGTVPTKALRIGLASSIMTGAPCPPGTEAVVPVEEVQVTGTSVLLPPHIREGQCLVRRGKECQAGALIAPEKSLVTPLLVANLATFGYQSVKVIRRPSVTVITTGSELVHEGQPVSPGHIRESNGPMLAALLSWHGAEEVRLLHAADTLPALTEALNQALESDVVITTGGVSAGQYDLVPQVLERLGVSTVFHGVQQKPGKPLLFGVRRNTLVFGLPGNPLSSYSCFWNYVLPPLWKLGGHGCRERTGSGTLTAEVKPLRDNTLFLFCKAQTSCGETSLQPLPGGSSADVFAACQANALLTIPPGEAPLRSGQILTFTWLET